MAARRILIVEDERELCYLLKMRLETNGYETITAFDGKEGLEKAHKEKPDLILLDLMLPKLDGYWVCDLLKKDKRYVATPIIIISAKAEKENLGLAKNCGADAYMEKPFDIEALLARIASLLK